MQRRASALVCCLLFFPCFGLISPESTSKCRYDRVAQVSQRTLGTRKYCDPSFLNQTSGGFSQKCSSGFYREQSGPHKGQCVLCSCNELSKICDPHTGNCQNCQHNTTGSRCERCKEGYYRSEAGRTCFACPCPSRRKNFALACMSISSEVIECLCKRGYSGARCERCAFGYYGNPLEDGGSCKPCDCNNGDSNMCNNRPGVCIADSNSMYECDSCTITLQLELEKLRPVHSRLGQLLQNITNTPGSILRLKPLEAKISDAQALVGNCSAKVKELDTEVGHTEGDVNVFRGDLTQLIDKSRQGVIDAEKISKNDTNIRAAALLSGAETLYTIIQDVSWRQAEVKPGDSELLLGIEKALMMEEAQRTVDDLQRKSCRWHRLKASREQVDAHMILDSLGQHVAVGTDRAELDKMASFLVSSGSFLEGLSDLLTNSEDTVDRAKGLNLKSQAALRHLKLEKQNISHLNHLTDMTKSLLKNASNTFQMLLDAKKEFENHAAQTDGARQELVNRASTARPVHRIEVITEAEEHAQGLFRATMELQQELPSALKRTVLSHSNINAVNEAERAANQSRQTADCMLQGVKDEGLAYKTEGHKEKSASLLTEAEKTQNDLKSLSSTVDGHKDRVDTQQEKHQLLTDDVSTLKNNINDIHRGDVITLVEAANNATFASNFTLSSIAKRLKSISLEVDKIEPKKWKTHMLNGADQMVEHLSTALPDLRRRIVQLQALSELLPPSGNMTESIWRIKDLIEETRNYVVGLPVATNFNGKSHVELHPPRDLEDLKAFTAVDLLLSRHINSRRRRQQGKLRHGSSFILYLGSKNASGDYVGMALRNNVLKCVYKLAGTVHQLDTNQLTSSSIEASSFDRVVFRRVYEDAEVDVTLDFTSQKPKSLPLRRSLPNTTDNLLSLDPDSLVFYVGGYPEDFTPPRELRYPGYRGAMKLSYVNDMPVSLFNYKNTNNLMAKQPIVKIPWSTSSAYYQGTGYSMALVKELEKRRRLIKFHTKSRQTTALLFYIGNKESFLCVLLERSLLVLQGIEAGREFRLSSANKVSLFNQQFSVEIKVDTLTVHCRTEKISTYHNLTTYRSYYIGGVPEVLRQRHNITTPALRGCVAHLTVDTTAVRHSRTVGVTDGCPLPLLAVRSATLRSPLPADSLFARGEEPLRVSLGFRSSSSKDGTVLRSSRKGLSTLQDFQLSLVDGFAVVKSDNYTLRTDTKCNDGKWHHLSAVQGPAGLELSIDNKRVTQLDHSRLQQKTKQKVDFTGCITNVYTRRLENGVAPVDLSLLSPPGDADLGVCRLSLPRIVGERRRVLSIPLLKTARRHTPMEAPAGRRCKKRQVPNGEHYFPQGHSWVSYSVPKGDLNYRPHFALDIKTKSSKGLILHAGGSGVVPLLALYVANGKIKMTLGHNRTIHHKLRSNDGKWHRVELSVEKSSFHLVVDGFRVSDGLLPNGEGSSLQLHNPVYLGGDLGGRNTKGHSVPMSSVNGCIRNFKMNEEVLWDAESSYGTLPCFSRPTEKGAYFGGGYIYSEIDFSTGSQFDLSFELRPHHLTGVLFIYRNDKASIVVFMREIKVVVEVEDEDGVVSVAVRPPETLCDGKFHLVKVSRENTELRLAVDYISKKIAAPLALWSNSPAALYIGGTANGNKATVSSPFIGCLRNVKLGGRPFELEERSQVFGAVDINSCPPE